jgi:hypothetical protein
MGEWKGICCHQIIKSSDKEFFEVAKQDPLNFLGKGMQVSQMGRNRAGF